MFRFISTKIAEYSMIKAQKELEKSDMTMADIYKFNRIRNAVKNSASWEDAFNKEFADNENDELNTEKQET